MCMKNFIEVNLNFFLFLIFVNHAIKHWNSYKKKIDVIPKVMSQETETIKVLIIGSGPAGYTDYTAAIYASRAGLSPVLYTGYTARRTATITNDVENYPGYPDGVMGPQMMEDFRKQAEAFWYGSQVWGGNSGGFQSATL